jgi:hypothetical protein
VDVVLSYSPNTKLYDAAKAAYEQTLAMYHARVVRYAIKGGTSQSGCAGLRIQACGSLRVRVCGCPFPGVWVSKSGCAGVRFRAYGCQESGCASVRFRVYGCPRLSDWTCGIPQASTLKGRLRHIVRVCHIEDCHLLLILMMRMATLVSRLSPLSYKARGGARF